eukprot:TRINITY_DN4592_c0_g1_i18.p1 TRINITY_DN4592_c0_g1~~TRINITY_DN4592_c0_g1_i18.p1  ORF type:complete len:167 (-),score=24.25 TRINITY_DN4592_c0_g1_i18:91-591(-)
MNNTAKLIQRAHTVLTHFRNVSSTANSFCIDAYKHMQFEKLALEDKSLRVFYEIPVIPELRNPTGPLHGGAYGLLADVATTMAICVLDPSEKQTVTVNMALNYLNPALSKDMVSIEAIVQKLGKSLAFTDFAFRNKTSQKLICTGSHLKAFVKTSFDIQFPPEQKL